ncbi:MAG: hypothetical protein ABIJ48_01720 [Actinomycetota bacterium]
MSRPTAQVAESYNIVADLEDADWPKRTWDLSPADGFIRQLASWPGGGVVRFSWLPVCRATPPEVKAAVEARLISRQG